jgi:(2Fe-2S) ferredoxin
MNNELKYQKHLFICTNQRAEGTRPSCGHDHGTALVAAFKKSIKDKNLNIPIRAQKAGCLDLCELGPTIVVYPEGVFYGNVTLADVEEIVNDHIVNGKPVDRLRLRFNQNIEK